MFRWDKHLQWEAQEIETILGSGELAPGKYAIKRVARDINDWTRVRIAEHFGYRDIVRSTVKKVGLWQPLV